MPDQSPKPSGAAPPRGSRTQHSFMAGVKDMLPILVGVVPFGLVAGAAVIHAGQGLAEAIGMSVIVFAGASQIIATTLFGDHAPLWVALVTALIVNSRMFIYSTSIAPLSRRRARVAAAVPRLHARRSELRAVMTQGRFRDDIDVVPYYVGAWAALASTWQVTSIAGALLGPGHPAVVGARLRRAARVPRDARAVAEQSNRYRRRARDRCERSGARPGPADAVRPHRRAARRHGVRRVARCGRSGRGGEPMSATAQFWLLIVLLGAGRGRCAASRSCCTATYRIRCGSSGCSSTSRWPR